MDKPYNIFDWYWQIGEDESRYWSSKTGRFCYTHPGEYEGLTKIDTAENLDVVLREYGLPGPIKRVPPRVSPAQAEIALFNYDNGVLLERVNTLINEYPYEPLRIWWRKATFIAREHPYIMAMALELELSDEIVDDLFIAADKITGMSNEQ